MSFSRLVYHSRASVDLGPCALSGLAAASRARNAERGLTGGLILYRDVFMQVIEGPHANVVGLFERLLLDPRHNAVTLVSLDPVDEPALPVWLAQLDAPETVEDYLALEDVMPPFDPDRLDAAAITRLVREACLARSFLVD